MAKQRQRSSEFGSLLAAICGFISVPLESTKTILYGEIADRIDRSESTVGTFITGTIPTNDQLMNICIFLHEKAPTFCTRVLLDDLLTKANCSIKENILNSIFPPNSAVNADRIVLHNLPTPTFHKYVLRKELEKDILSALNSFPTLFISSFGGNGKSSCVYNFAQRYVEKTIRSSIDVVIWVSDKGSPGQTTLDTIYTTLLKTLEVENATSLISADKEQLVQSILIKHNVLFIIDNFETITDKNISYFINDKMPANCKAIITCRHALQNYPELKNCEPIEVGGMSKDEIKELIGNRLERHWKVLSAHIDEGFWNNLMDITGGNPFAAQAICGGLSETVRNGGDFQTTFKDYFIHKNDILNGIFDELLKKSWALLSTDAKTMMMISSFFPKSVSSTAIKEILSWQDARIEKAIGLCLTLNLLDPIVINEDLKVLMRYSQHPLVFSFMKHTKEETDIESLTNAWIKYYLNLTGNIGFAYNHVIDFSIYDIEGEMDALNHVLAYCEQNEKLKELITISNNTRYYFYIRGFWKKGKESIHIKRADAAKKLEDKQAEFDALVYQINIAAKRKESDEVSLHLDRAEEIMCNNELTSESIIKFNHAKALYLSSVGDDSGAVGLWNENLTEYCAEMNAHDYNANIRWKARSLLRLGEEDQKSEAIGLLTEASKSAEQENFLRGYLDSNLILADYYLENEDVKSAENIVAKIESRIKEPRDNKYIAELYVVKAKIALSYNETTGARNNLKLALEHLEKSLHYNRIQELKDELDAQLFDSC